MTSTRSDGAIPLLQADGPQPFKETIFPDRFCFTYRGGKKQKRVSHHIQMFEAIIPKSREFTAFFLFYIAIISTSLGHRRGWMLHHLPGADVSGVSNPSVP
ncbi:hypothetical protein NPIL_45531 [Nephila pilipes]|uniref:Uncharacterized protein n=1 Tax=Nephila pilipes TaxID=299642 RepID=A0A8X6P0L7_NEPPI|nr:hypothetical protein NPIL_45531 [Nephila pilipes]